MCRRCRGGRSTAGFSPPCAPPFASAPSRRSFRACFTNGAQKRDWCAGGGNQRADLEEHTPQTMASGAQFLRHAAPRVLVTEFGTDTGKSGCGAAGAVPEAHAVVVLKFVPSGWRHPALLVYEPHASGRTVTRRDQLRPHGVALLLRAVRATTVFYTEGAAAGTVSDCRRRCRDFVEGLSWDWLASHAHRKYTLLR